jgi:hypothetical protein
MPGLVLIPLDRPEVPPRGITPRLRTQLVYFGSPAGAPGVPVLGENEYYFAADEVAKWLDDGAISLVSPLDTANKTEVELTEEQEALLEWLRANGVQHVRAEGP